MCENNSAFIVSIVLIIMGAIGVFTAIGNILPAIAALAGGVLVVLGVFLLTIVGHFSHSREL